MNFQQRTMGYPPLKHIYDFYFPGRKTYTQRHWSLGVHNTKADIYVGMHVG